MLLLQQDPSAQGSGSAQAQFVALATIKEALRREGRLLGQQQLHALKEQLLQLVQARVNTWSRYVLKQCLHVISILCKWLCLDADEAELRVGRAAAAAAAQASASSARPVPSPSPPPDAPTQDPTAYLSMANTVASWLQQGAASLEAEASAAATGSPSSSGGRPVAAATLFSLALELSTALVGEFSPGGQAANAGVSVSMHVRCHARFEQHVLLNLANMVVQQCLPDLLRRLMAQAQAQAQTAQQQQQQAQLHPVLLQHLHVLHSLLSFLDAVLHFDFRDPRRPEALQLRWALAGSSAAIAAAPSSVAAGSMDSVLVKPGPAWAPILVRAQLLEMIVAAHSVLHGLSQACGSAQLEARWPQLSDTSHLLRTCLLQLASLHGEVLKPPAAAEGSGGIVVTPEANLALINSQGAGAFFARVLGAVNALLATSLTAATQAVTTAQQQRRGRGDDLLPDRVGADLLGCASVVQRLLVNARERLLLLSDTSLMPHMINLQQQLALFLIPLSHSSSSGSRKGAGPRLVRTSTVVSEALDAVLEVWSTLIAQLDELSEEEREEMRSMSSMSRGGGGSAGQHTRLQQHVPAETLRAMQSLVAQSSGRVFESYVLAHVGALEAHKHSNGSSGGSGARGSKDEDDDLNGGDDDDDEEEGQFAESDYIDEHMSKVASLGRAHTTAALALLGSKLATSLREWQHIASVVQQTAQPPPPHTLYAMHELQYFLLRLLGHLLAAPGAASWRDLEGEALFASLPRSVLQAVASQEQSGAASEGAQALKAAIDAVMQMALFVPALLEAQAQAQASASGGSALLSPTQQMQTVSLLKECCSPLVLECMVWLLQQLLSTGYFLIDARCVTAGCNTLDGRPFPAALLHLYAAPSSGGGGAGGGCDGLQVVHALLRLSGSLLTHYNEEVELVDSVADLLDLCVKHVPVRAVLQAQLTEQVPQGQQPPLFRALFHDSFLQLLTTDPFLLMDAAAAATPSSSPANASSSSPSSGPSGTEMLRRYQASQPLYNLSANGVRRLAHVLVQSMVFDSDSDDTSSPPGSSPPGHAAQMRAHKRAVSVQLLHNVLVSVSRSFYSVLLHPHFMSARHRPLLLRSLTSLVSFWSGLVRELHRDYFEILWHWLTCTEQAATIPPQQQTQQASIEAQIKQQAREADARRHAFKQAQKAAGQVANAAAAMPGGRNVLQSMVDIVRAYAAEDASSPNSPARGGGGGGGGDESGSGSLELLSSILSFFTSLCSSFLSYLDVGQSYLFMHSSVQLVTAFTALMDRRTSAATLQMRKAQGGVVSGSAGSRSRNTVASAAGKSAALASDLSLLEESEWSSLHALLLLLEGLSTKDQVDMSEESVEFSSDAVLQGLVLLVPRLAGGSVGGSSMLAQPEVATLFFSLLSQLISSNPDKLAVALDEQQRTQLMHMILVVLQPPPSAAAPGEQGSNGAAAASSPSSAGAAQSASSAAATLFGHTTAQLHGQLLKEACMAVQALAQYHLYFSSGRAEAERLAAAKEDADAARAASSAADAARRVQLTARPPAPPPSPYGPALGAFLESLLNLLCFAPLGSEALQLEAVSDALLPAVMCQPAHMRALVQGAMQQWKANQVHRLAAQASQLSAQDGQMAQAQLERLSVDLETAFGTLLPPASKKSVAALVSPMTVGSRFSDISSSAMRLQLNQRQAYRQQVRTFVLTARPILAMR
jgi:hypothetical protein